MKKQLIIIGIIVILLFVGLSGCEQKSTDTEDIVEKTHFTIAGTITNNYAEDIDIDYSVVENFNEWAYWAPTIRVDSYEAKNFSCEVKLGYELYLFIAQWFYPNTDTEGCLIVTESVENTTGEDLTFYIEVKSNGEIEISQTEPKLTTNKAPTVTIDASITSGNAPLTVSFTSEAVDSDGSIVSYSWNFDDEETSTEENPTHTFQSYGTFNVKLTVADDKGATSFDTIIIKSQFPDPELVTHGFVEIGSSTRVFGIIKNVGNDDIKVYLPTVTLYDASDNYINSNNRYYQSWADGVAPDIIKPQEKAFFCVQIEENWFDHYEIDITYDRTSGKTFTDRYGLTITDHFFETIYSGDAGGHVKNTGTSAVTNSFNVIGAFYDKSGSLVYVDVDTIYLSSYSSLYSGQSTYFDFYFGWGGLPFSIYDITNYELAIGPDD